MDNLLLLLSQMLAIFYSVSDEKNFVETMANAPLFAYHTQNQLTSNFYEEGILMGFGYGNGNNGSWVIIIIIIILLLWFCQDDCSPSC